MHIVIVTSQYPGPGNRKHRGTYIQALAKALAKKHQVTVMAPYFAPMKEIFDTPPQSVIQEDGLTVYQPRYLYIRYISRLIDVLTCIWHARKINWASVDIIHANWSIPSGFAAACLSWWYRKPFILTEHSGDFDALTTKLVFRLLVHWTIKQTQRLIVVSNSLKNKIRHQGIVAKFSIVPNVLNTKVFFPVSEKETNKEPSNTFQLLWVGDFAPYERYLRKGSIELIEAIALSQSQTSKKLMLTVVGQGSLQKEFETYAKKLGVANLCHFSGRISNVEVRNLIQNCDALILASRSESFGMVLIEAMGCGKPVIATRCGGPEDIVTPETGILVEAGNSQALADGIIQMIENYDQYNPEVISVYAHTTYDADKIATQLIQIYIEVLNS